MRFRVIPLFLLFFLACGDREEIARQRKESARERLDAAIRLGESLATVHATLSRAGNSEKARRLTALYWDQFGKKEAARLGVTVPASALTDQFDPRVEEEMRRIAAQNGTLLAHCFAFSYHSAYASDVAKDLANVTAANDPFGSYRFQDVILTVHTDLALRSARELGEADILQAAETLPREIRTATRLPLSPERARAMATLHRKLGDWHASLAIR